MTTMGLIVAPTNPSFDAVGAAWLLQRYGGLVNDDVVFLGHGDDTLLAGARAVVDTGGRWDETNLRFDHHHLPRAESNATCAMQQVYEWVTKKGAEVAHLRPLLHLMFCAETGRKEYGAATSYITGIHAALNGWKRRNDMEEWDRHSRDTATLRKGYELLDDVDAALASRYEARDAMVARTLWQSDDGVLRVLSNSTTTMTHLAHDEGAKMVVFESSHRIDGRTSYAMGVMRSDEHRYLNMGYLLHDALHRFGAELGAEAVAELELWHPHPSGFMAGRGTKKNPNYTPSVVDPVQLGKVLHRAYCHRELVRLGLAPLEYTTNPTHKEAV